MNHCFNSILITASLYCILIQSNCIAQEFKSPYQIGWGKESIVVSAGFVNGILASSFDDTVSVVTPFEIQQLDRNSVNILDRLQHTITRQLLQRQVIFVWEQYWLRRLHS